MRSPSCKRSVLHRCPLSFEWELVTFCPFQRHHKSTGKPEYLYFQFCLGKNQRSFGFVKLTKSYGEVKSSPFQKKVVFFRNLDFLYRKSYSKFERFWWLSQDLVVFFRCTEKWSVQHQSWIVRRIFYRFSKTFFKVVVFLVGRSSLPVWVRLQRPTQHFSSWSVF